MSRIDTDATVGQLVSQNPGLARIFEDLGIDYCCGGKIPLAQAARNRGLDARAVAARLEAAVNQPAPDGANWAEAPLGELIDHILRTHHDYLRRELPRLTELTSKVAAVHGPNHSELAEVAGVFQALREEL